MENGPSGQRRFLAEKTRPTAIASIRTHAVDRQSAPAVMVTPPSVSHLQMETQLEPS